MALTTHAASGGSSRDRVDLLIVGGGVNGTGIARDAAGRGLAVLLCEQGDLAGATSSASSKLIHGGLRYLEHYEFRLVREALAEREVLLKAAPHIIWPLRFVLPHHGGLRPAWLVRLGLFLYDNLSSRRTLPGTAALRLRSCAEGRPLKPELTRGFAYSDCWVDDSRLVVLNALDARARGAEILVRTRCTAATRLNGEWRVTLTDQATGAERPVATRALVNAAGPWVDRFLHRTLGRNEARHVRLVKGSHIVVPRLHDGDFAYIFQNADRRVIFAIPYEQRFTLIGTTDIEYRGDPGAVAISAAEIEYLCAAASRYLARPIAPAEVVGSYAGLRPLYDDGSGDPAAITRDYTFELDAPDGRAPLLSIFGGKITTYRRLAEHALDRLKPFLPQSGRPWTATAPLPGGDLPDGDPIRFLAALTAAHPWLPADLARRYVRQYGTLCLKFLDGAAALADLGTEFGAGLHEREALWLVGQEWARTAEDILWRRTKLGLIMPPEGAARLEVWLAERQAGADRALAG